MKTVATAPRPGGGFALLALGQASLIFIITLIAVPRHQIGTEFALLLTDNMAPQRRGLAGGVTNTAMELGPRAGPAAYMALASLRVDVVEGYRPAFTGAAVSFAVAAVLCLSIYEGGRS